MFEGPDLPDPQFSGTGVSSYDADSEILSSFPSPQNPEGDLYLRFFVESGEEFALAAMGIREVLSVAPEQITPVPNVSPLLMGVFNFRGQVIWISDVGQFLGGTRLLNTERTEIPIIVIESQDIMVGLAGERVRGMEWLNLDALTPSSSHSTDSMTPFLKGEWEGISEKPLRLLDPTSILRSARWAA
jgi:purine-binding chemotaxis protein CheW